MTSFNWFIVSRDLNMDLSKRRNKYDPQRLKTKPSYDLLRNNIIGSN